MEPETEATMPGKRRTAREMALQMLYQSDLGGSGLPQIFNTFELSGYLSTEPHEGGSGDGKGDGRPEDGPEDGSEAGGPLRPGKKPGRHRPAKPGKERRFRRRRRQMEQAFDYARTLVEGTLEHQEEIDGLIRDQADNWRLERMPPVDRNILRLAIFEMLYERDVPKLVVVDEAIELAKRFGSEQSGRFVNGLLDGLLKQHSFPGKLK